MGWLSAFGTMPADDATRFEWIGGRDSRMLWLKSCRKAAHVSRSSWKETGARVRSSRWIQVRRVDTGTGLDAVSRKWLDLWRTELPAADESVQGVPLAPAWLRLFEAHLSDSETTMLRWRGHLGKNAEMRRVCSGPCGRCFARAALTAEPGIDSLVPLQTDSAVIPGGVTVNTGVSEAEAFATGSPGTRRQEGMSPAKPRDARPKAERISCLASLAAKMLARRSPTRSRMRIRADGKSLRRTGLRQAPGQRTESRGVRSPCFGFRQAKEQRSGPKRHRPTNATGRTQRAPKTRIGQGSCRGGGEIFMTAASADHSGLDFRCGGVLPMQIVKRPEAGRNGALR